MDLSNLLSAFPLGRIHAVEPPSSEGFSGAFVRRIVAEAGVFCLKGWPPGVAPAELAKIHSAMARAERLSFVPKVLPTAQGTTLVQHAGRVWDVSTWMPGKADFRDRPSAARMYAAGRTLATLHDAWKPASPIRFPIPAVERRLAITHSWRAVLAAGIRPKAARDPRLADVVARLWLQAPTWIEKVEATLAPTAHREISCQLCLCDVWHDHVLFDRDDVVGLIDFGGVKLDHSAVDVSRLFGSLAEDDASFWSAGLAGYRSVRPFSGDYERLARVLDTTGTWCSLLNWAERLGLATETANLAGAIARIERLMQRSCV